MFIQTKHKKGRVALIFIVALKILHRKIEVT